MMWFLLGVFTWITQHYWGHRFWHYAIKHGWKKEPFLPELEHHRLYDHSLACFPDPYASFPAYLWVIMVFTIILHPTWFTLGIMFGFLLDDWIHRACHAGGGGTFGRWHKEHHATHSTHFAIGLGFFWDYIAGTWR